MKAVTYIEYGKFALLDKPKPEIIDPRDAVVRVTLGSICTSDLHIKHGSVPRAVPGITVGHEMVGVVEEVGSAVTTVKPGDRVTVNVETFCGDFEPAEVIRFVRLELKKLGFLLNEQKTRIQRPGQQQTVTGIVVNEKLSIPADYRRKLRQELYYCRKLGIQEHLQKIGLEIPEETYRMQLLGKVNYVLQIHPDDKDMHEARKWLQQSTK